MDIRKKIDNFYDKYPIGMWGLIGVGFFVFLGLLICQIGATDEYGLNYSWKNHAISELGFFGIGNWSWWLFSLCLIVGGSLACVFFLGFGLYIQEGIAGVISKIAMVLGWICAIGMIGVGFTPANIFMDAHIRTAMTFFLFAAITPPVYSLAILAQNKTNKKIPRWTAILGFIVSVVVIRFLTQMGGLSEELSGTRPPIIDGLFWEWMVFYSVSIWMIIFAYHTRKETTRKK